MFVEFQAVHLVQKLAVYKYTVNIFKWDWAQWWLILGSIFKNVLLQKSEYHAHANITCNYYTFPHFIDSYRNIIHEWALGLRYGNSAHSEILYSAVLIIGLEN